MTKEKYFAHDSPVYGRLTLQFEEFGGIRLGIETSLIGENLVKNDKLKKSQIKAKDIIASWMNSPGHKENILNEYYTYIGISVYYSDKLCFAAQEFMCKYE